MDFVAIDVETANNDIASICQIGIVGYQDGKPVKSWSSLINPEDYFNSFNIQIHGIHQVDVQDAPTFEQVYEQVAALLANEYVVSHTFFDKTAITKSIEKYNLPSIETKWIDSVKIARKAWGHIPLASYGLANVCQFIGFKFKHHDALEDAKACAAVLNAALLDTETKPADWHELAAKTKPKSKPRKKSAAPIVNPNGKLIGHSITFTGTLSITRNKATELAAHTGCIVSKTVFWHTNYLVIGSSKKPAVGKSTKQIQAEKFIQNGHKIRILSEEEFHILIN